MTKEFINLHENKPPQENFQERISAIDHLIKLKTRNYPGDAHHFLQNSQKATFKLLYLRNGEAVYSFFLSGKNEFISYEKDHFADSTEVNIVKIDKDSQKTSEKYAYSANSYHHQEFKNYSGFDIALNKIQFALESIPI